MCCLKIKSIDFQSNLNRKGESYKNIKEKPSDKNSEGYCHY